MINQRHSNDDQRYILRLRELHCSDKNLCSKTPVSNLNCKSPKAQLLPVTREVRAATNFSGEALPQFVGYSFVRTTSFLYRNKLLTRGIEPEIRADLRCRLRFATDPELRDL